eukprot:TRINITY_DN10055_c0_g1_i1.p1 TRINITY_DN10055_c0_g1~~TRINITY_DN10055_c0_g1_i1.p1  ORF type:complete len:143 (+),score=24.39 TRINITY_DN10055_c0_g1_i1:234-662(+)
MCAAKLGDRVCKSKALNGGDYCWHHAPLDPNSTYVWCNYIDPKNSKKCNIPVQKNKKLPYCNYHIKAAEENQPVVKSESESVEERGLELPAKPQSPQAISPSMSPVSVKLMTQSNVSPIRRAPDTSQSSNPNLLSAEQEENI